VANLNANFQRTFNSLDGINNSVKIIHGNIENLTIPTKSFSEKTFTVAAGINHLLEVAGKVAPVIMNAANAANVLEANINKAALSNMWLVQGFDGGYNNLSQNVTRSR